MNQPNECTHDKAQDGAGHDDLVGADGEYLPVGFPPVGGAPDGDQVAHTQAAGAEVRKDA